MIHSTLPEFFAALPSNRRLLGLDVGSKRVGLAISDTTRMIASAYGTLERMSFSKDMGKLNALIQEHSIGGVVIGLPKNMDGSEGESCTMVRAFGEKLHKKCPDIAIFYHDERMSTAAVNRTLIEADLTRKKRATLDDKMAAAYILQGVLDGGRLAP